MKQIILSFLICSGALFGISSSAPYISGDTFRAAADFVFDEIDSSLRPEKTWAGCTIFVKIDYLDHFLKKIHPELPYPYKLITHNGDLPIPGKSEWVLDDEKLIGWYGQNLEGKHHPKLHPIPIGLANRRWEHGNTAIFDEVGGVSHSKKHLLYLNITVNTYYEERSRVYTLFSKAPFCFSAKPKPVRDYLTDLAESKFVLSPRGNGIDCHRTWEALYMGAIPIVRTSPLDSIYEELPVLIVDNWEVITEEFLEEKYREITSRCYNWEKLNASYWFDLLKR